jgi:hypothetical protein
MNGAKTPLCHMSIHAHEMCKDDLYLTATVLEADDGLCTRVFISFGADVT